MQPSRHVIAVIGIIVGSLPSCGPSSAPAPALGSAVAPPPTPDAPPRPATCEADTDCNFAESAPITECIVGPAPAADKQPAKPDGRCVCLAGRCALRPNSERISQHSCNSAVNDCELDLPTARCEAGITPSELPRGRSYGPSCTCGHADQRCHLRWFDPIACRTTDDCWSSDEPVRHAIPRPPRLRGRKFRGCVDGEHVPSCVRGRCVLEALKC